MWSYAKGQIDSGETPQQTARRELTEETGLTGRIVGWIDDFCGDTSVTRFYVGVPTGGEKKQSSETSRIGSIGPFTALARLNKQRDKDVFVRLVEIAAGIVEWSWTLGGHPMRCRLTDGQIRAEREAPSHSDTPHDL